MAYIDTIITYSLWGMGAIIVTLILVWVNIIRKYKHTVIIRKVVNNRTVVRITKARTWADDDGSKWWKILKADSPLEKKLPHPPEDAIDIREKGKLLAEVHQMESGEYHWVQDDIKSHNFKTIPANQKIILANQIRKAEEERNSLFQKHFKTFVIGAFVLMALAMVLIFGGELLEPLTTMGDSFRATADILNEAMEKDGEVQIRIAEIEHNVQTLQDSDELENIGQGETE